MGEGREPECLSEVLYLLAGVEDGRLLTAEGLAVYPVSILVVVGHLMLAVALFDRRILVVDVHLVDPCLDRSLLAVGLRTHSRRSLALNRSLRPVPYPPYRLPALGVERAVVSVHQVRDCPRISADPQALPVVVQF